MERQQKIELLIEALKVLSKDEDEKVRDEVTNMLVLELTFMTQN